MAGKVEANPQFWLDRAEEARRVAEGLTHSASKQELLRIAAAYLRMAKTAQDCAHIHKIGEVNIL
jgi:hypothetical protein